MSRHKILKEEDKRISTTFSISPNELNDLEEQTKLQGFDNKTDYLVCKVQEDKNRISEIILEQCNKHKQGWEQIKKNAERYNLDVGEQKKQYQEIENLINGIRQKQEEQKSYKIPLILSEVYFFKEMNSTNLGKSEFLKEQIKKYNSTFKTKISEEEFIKKLRIFKEKTKIKGVE